MDRDAECWRFGPFEIRPASGELLQSGNPLKLAPQPFQVLSLIVRGAGAVVTRAQLREAIWSDGTTVEFDHGLNFCIRQIRIALNDDARRPTYIETVPKRGYRLRTPVEAITGAPISSTAGSRRAGWLGVVGFGTALLLTVTVWSVTHRSPPDLPVSESLRLFREAEHLAGTWERDKVSMAVERYQAALRLTPTFAPAWAGLANTNVILTFLGTQPAQALADSEVHARRALELDGSLSEARAALGHSHWHRWKWREAAEEFERALALDDQAPVTHQLFGLYLASIGRVDDAILHARRAVELAPVSGAINYSLAHVYLQTGHYDLAVEQAHRTLEIDRHFPLAFQALFRAEVQLGRIADAMSAFEAQQRYSPEEVQLGWQAFLLARAGRMTEARNVMDMHVARRRRASLADAAAFVAMHNVDAAFASLDEGVSAHVPSMVWLQVAPELTAVRNDRRFASLLARMKLPFLRAVARR
jgi:DNA-binding winged helix-turn-helix (wHTH) protein/Tfp pilus assembly protein PilF